MSKNNYSNSKVYKLYDNTNGDVYYGSTTQSLAKRLAVHKSDAKRGKPLKSNSIILNGDYCVSLVEEFCCKNKEHLHARERYYIENFNCVNKNIPGRTKKEYNDDHKEEFRAYYIQNRDRIKAYCDSHKDHKSEYDKKRYLQKKQRLLDELKALEEENDLDVQI